MTDRTKSMAASAADFDIAQWENFFTTREGALADLAAVRSSLSWRVTRPLREASTAARRARTALMGTAATPHPAGSAAAALDDRLRTVAPHLLDAGTAAHAAALPTEDLLLRLCAAVADAPGARTWLLFIAIAGTMPDETRLASFTRALSRSEGSVFMADLLRVCGGAAASAHSQLHRLSLQTETPVLLVDLVARRGINTGVQRVTRQVATRWVRRSVRLAAMTNDATALRDLHDDERERVVSWDSSMYHLGSMHDDAPDLTVIVPWRTTLVIPEVPGRAHAPALSALAHHSGSRVVMLGYDTIPITSAGYVWPETAVDSAAYLTIVRHATRLVAISATAGTEFAGFASALAAQGLTGPDVTSLVLPAHYDIPLPAGEHDTDADDDDAVPLVVAVGSHEPRKNQIALVYAAERLWREGLRFRVELLGERGPVDYTDVHDAVAALRVAGRPIRIRNGVTDDVLYAAYHRARFTAFLSFHEGYGLPVAESLSSGTPVLCTDYGSVAEIAAGGGCLTVNPHDDDAIAEGMRALLTDEALISRLRLEIAERRDPGWDEYAAQLWQLATTEEAGA